MTTVQQLLDKLNVKYSKTWSNWHIKYTTPTSFIVERVNLKDRVTALSTQQTLTESVHINGVFTPVTAVEDVIMYLHS